MTEPLTSLTASTGPAAPKRNRWRSLWRNPSFVVSSAIIALLVLIAAFPAFFAQLFGNGDPRVCDLSASGMGPSSGHPFGLDLQGCDVYANVIFGTQTSISVGVLTTAFSVIIAIIAGTLAGMFGGWIDWVVSRITDIFLGFPLLLGAIVVLNTAGERTVLTVSAVLALFVWPVMARLMRGSVRAVRQSDYVLAATTMGLGSWRVIARYVLPNSLSPLVVIATLTVGGVIVSESTLTYLGIGLKAPSISWGLQLAAATSQFQNNPHLLIFPSLFLLVTVLSIITLGDTLRAVLDPRRQQ